MAILRNEEQEIAQSFLTGVATQEGIPETTLLADALAGIVRARVYEDSLSIYYNTERSRFSVREYMESHGVPFVGSTRSFAVLRGAVKVARSPLFDPFPCGFMEFAWIPDEAMRKAA